MLDYEKFEEDEKHSELDELSIIQDEDGPNRNSAGNKRSAVPKRKTIVEESPRYHPRRVERNEFEQIQFEMMQLQGSNAQQEAVFKSQQFTKAQLKLDLNQITGA